jgi:hypothetical protein
MPRRTIGAATILLSTTLLAGILSCALTIPASAQVDPVMESKTSDLKAREAGVRHNMRMVQLAADTYQIYNKGKYPIAIDNAFKSYSMDGKQDNKTPGKPVFNAFTNTEFWPTLGKPSDIAAIRAGQSFKISPGSIIYVPIDNGKSYAIVGGDADGQPIKESDSSKPMIIVPNDTDFVD